MPTDKELMQQALDALINAKGYIFHNVLDDKANQYDTAVEALRARLAQPERAWQGLTDEEQLEIMKQFGPGQRGLFADAIEAKLKEKNI